MSTSDLLAEIQSLKAMITQLKDRSDRQESLMSGMMSNICNIIPPSMLSPEILSAINSVRQMYDLPPISEPTENPESNEGELSTADNLPTGPLGNMIPDCVFDGDGELLRALPLRQTLYPDIRYAMVNTLFDCDPALSKPDLYRLPTSELEALYDRTFGSGV